MKPASHTATAALIVVVAHKLEAAPLLNAFDLTLQQSQPFRVYANDMGLHLVISGQGKLAAATATAHMGAQLDQADVCAPGFLNFGIAGHGEAAVGQGFMINRLIDRATSEVHYPTPLPGRRSSTALMTVDQAELDYGEALAYDMEGTGFFSAALRYTDVDRVQLYKLVSDNPARDASLLNRKQLTALLSDHQQELAEVVNEQLKASQAYQALYALPSLWACCTSALHLTVSQRHQLKKLLRRCRALGLDEELDSLPVDRLSSRQLLGLLQQRLREAE